jgi:hypothetical protein
LASATLLAADQFDHHIGIALGQAQHVVGPAGYRETARLVFITRRHRCDLQRASGAARQLFAVGGKRLHHAAPDRAETGDGNLEARHFAGAKSVFLLSCGAILVPMVRNFFTLRAAWRMRCSFSTSATRT